MLIPEEVRLLDALALGGFAPSDEALSAGVRRSRGRHAGHEFYEYRPYEAGDDLRRIDWTIEARLRQLVVRVARPETGARLHVLIDGSGSMAAGLPGKLACSLRIAAALCWVAAHRRDATAISVFSGSSIRHLGSVHGRQQAFRLLETLASTEAGGRSDIDHALSTYARTAQGRGLVVVISDFFDAQCRLDGVRALLGRGLTPALVQVVMRDEIDPTIAGLTELRDIENDSAAPLWVDETMVRAYRARVAGHTEWLRTFGLANGVPWVQIEAAVPFRGLLAALERTGLFLPYA